jgi:hypothetical protein
MIILLAIYLTMSMFAHADRFTETRDVMYLIPLGISLLLTATYGGEAALYLASVIQ